MFLHQSVILFTVVGEGAWQGRCVLQGGMHNRWHVWQGDMCEGRAWQGGVCGRGACMTGDMHGRGVCVKGVHDRGCV